VFGLIIKTFEAASASSHIPDLRKATCRAAPVVAAAAR
jgi:hypothetical protein